jgi:hypothetical protein
MPARAAYAAAEAEVLPVEAQMTARWPFVHASVTAIVMPRSLNEPVGLAPSTFRCTSHPVSSERYRAGTSGVAPSSSVMAVQSRASGNRCR